MAKWSIQSIKEVKAEFKSKLDSLGSASDANAADSRLKYALASVSALEKEDSEESRLKRFVACISCLGMHERHGGLKSSQLKELPNIALGILKVQKIDPAESTFAFLYGEVFTIRGQLLRKSGDHWGAAWEQQLAMRYTTRLRSA